MIQLEKRFLKSDFEKTPHSILEELCRTLDERRIDIERKMTKLRSKIKMLKNEHAEMVEESKTLSGEELKQAKDGLAAHKEMIDKNNKEWRLLRINTDILWQNQLKIGAVLGYDLS